MKKLEGKELYQRLQEARNAKRLHAAAIQQNEELKKKLAAALKLIDEMSKKMKVMEQTIEAQGLLLEEYSRIIFGKKKKGKDDDDENTGTTSSKVKEPGKKRAKSSYQRPIPAQISETENHTINQCGECETELQNRRTVERYIEDMILPDINHNPWKKVVKKKIETGWCSKCRKQRSPQPIRGAQVQLGPNVRSMVVYLIVVQKQTYSQVSDFFNDLVQIKISDGKIAGILNDQAMRAGPEYARIEGSIAKEKGVHADETAWKTLKGAEGNYAWVKTGTESFDTIFRLGKSRGKGNAQKIIMAEHPHQTGISDNYPAYDNIFENHELCWSHPLRKFRDLKDSSIIFGAAKARCMETFLEFQQLYADCEELREKQIPFEKKKHHKPALMKRFVDLMQPEQANPKKLQTIKKTLLEKRENYFVWLKQEGIPLDNNKAERALRPLVIKRKISFGSKTAKGADNLGVLFSVVMSLWWKRPPNFFRAYADLLA